MSVLTFLFTDIEGSTRRWEADADAMRVALAAHDELMRETVEVYQGRLFKHTGDGVCAAFDSPRSAVDAAVAAQRVLELPVRMGIATGEAEVRDGDYFGSVLNRAARVMAAGHGGQILLDGVTAELLTGVDLAGLGSRRLRDITKPVTVFQVLADGLRTEFPPLKTVDSTPGNLRRPSNSFVGRDAEIADLQVALKAHRLVTLTGAGGVGKTRLALEVGTRLAHEFPEGVWVTELAPVGDPTAVPDAVATALGISQQPGRTVAESVAAALEGRSRLLVFDNCEHVLDAAADIIETILAASATITILATSREGLRLSDEQLWPVAPLDVDESAARLFVERAGSVVPDFCLGDDAGPVTDVCRRLDGIPLAIELAASRLVSMTVSELRDRLDDRFRLLVGSRRGLARHQTLRHAVQWSYDLLDEAEKSLLQRCSVFAGGFDVAGAQAVCGSDDEFVTLDTLDALVRKSVLVADLSSGRTRFTMLETIRQFGEEQLIRSAEVDLARSAHARYFAERESDLLALWDGPRQCDAYSWLKAEMANLRAAFRWAAGHDDLDTAATIAYYAAFVGFWGDQHEPIRWAEELIGPARTARHRRLAQLYGIASLCYTAGRTQDAIGYASAGQEAVRSGLYDALLPELEPSLGSPYSNVGRSELWVEWCRDVIARRPTAHASLQSVLVLALVFSGACEDAIAEAKPLLAAADETDNPNRAAWALFSYGLAHRHTDPAHAYEILRRGLPIAQLSGSRLTEASIASVLSSLAVTQGNPVDAFDLVTVSIRYYYDSGSSALMANPLISLVVLLDRLGFYEAAASISGFAATPFAQSAFPETGAVVAHLRDVLGEEVYESFARTGEHMMATTMAAYAFEQIALARAELLADPT